MGRAEHWLPRGMKPPCLLLFVGVTGGTGLPGLFLLFATSGWRCEPSPSLPSAGGAPQAAQGSLPSLFSPRFNGDILGNI